MITALTIVHVVLCVLLIAIVLFQSGKQQGLSGSIGGGAEQLFGKKKSKGYDAILSKVTTGCAIVFFIGTIILTALK